MLSAVPVSLLALVVAVASLAGGGREQEAGVEFQFGGVAEAVASDYLAGRPFPIPVAHGVPAEARVDATQRRTAGPDEIVEPKDIGVRSISPVSSESFTLPGPREIDPERYFETHRFAVTTDAGDYFWLSVTIGDNKGPVLAALPQFEPAIVGEVPATGDSGILWSEIAGSRQLSPEAPARIERWLAAYGLDDRDGLRELTGDSRTDVEYLGLGGFRLVGSPSIINSGGPEGGNQAIARVQATFESVDDPDVVFVTEFDLLVQNLDGSLPTITAWGPVGSGIRLVPLMNAQPRRSASETGTAPSGAPDEDGIVDEAEDE